MPTMKPYTLFSSGPYNPKCRIYAQSGEITQETTPVSVEQTQLTTIVTSQTPQIETGDIGRFPFYREVDPMPDQGMSQVLSRKYRVQTFTWAGSSAQGALLATLNFPYALLQVAPNLLEKINRFHYFRADVELEVHVAGTMYHQGCIMAAVMPFHNGSATDPKFKDVYVMSTLDHIHISPDANTTTKILIPFKHFASYWRHDMNTDVGYIGTVVFRVLFPLVAANSTGIPSIPVTIFASFKNPQVMGPTLHAQSGEQKAKSSSGLLSKTLEGASQISSALTVVPGLSPYAQVASGFLSNGAKFSKLFGLNKPDSIETYKPVYLSTTNGLANMNGMNVVNTLTMDVENFLSNTPDNFGHSIPETNLSYLQSMPGMFMTGEIDTTDTAGTVVAKWHNSPHIAPATTTLIQYIPCSAVAMNFAHWQGDMKYTLYFKASKFTCAKVRIAYHPTFSEIVLSPEGEGDFPSQVIEISGDKTFSFKVPYLKDDPYSIAHNPTDSTWTESQYAGAVSLSVVNPITSLDGDVTLKIPFAVYAACDTNMTFSTPVEVGFTEITDAPYIDLTNALVPPLVAQSGETKDNTLTPHAHFSQDFPYLFPAKSHTFSKVCFGETVSSCLDLLHRFCLVKPDGVFANNSPQDFRYPPKNALGLTVPYAFDFFRYWFYFARGGISYKFLPRDHSVAGVSMDGTLYAQNLPDTQIVIPDTLVYGRVGTVMENFHYKPALDISIGHYSMYPFWWREWNYPTNYLSHTHSKYMYNGIRVTWKTLGTSDLNYYMFIAARDDTSFGYAKGCPKVSFTGAGLSVKNPDQETFSRKTKAR